MSKNFEFWIFLNEFDNHQLTGYYHSDCDIELKSIPINSLTGVIALYCWSETFLNNIVFYVEIGIPFFIQHIPLDVIASHVNATLISPSGKYFVITSEYHKLKVMLLK